jgi:ABC-2 type transport system permease protein/lipopolysaccharide transport system permease protein
MPEGGITPTAISDADQGVWQQGGHLTRPLYTEARMSTSARRRWAGDYLYLFQNLLLKDFRVRYRAMSLGVLWSLINPLVMMAVLTFVFGRVFGGDRPPLFPVFVLCGLVPYNFFTLAFLSGTLSIVENAPLVKRVPLPREIVPVVAVLSHVVHLLIQIALLIAFVLAFGLRPSAAWMWLPVVWVFYIVFICGLSLGASALNVYIRDTRYLVESFNMILFYLVPIFYSFSIIPARYARVYQFNPVAAMVLATRNILLDGKAPPMSLVSNLMVAAAFTTGLGLLIFAQLKARFYEHI